MANSSKTIKPKPDAKKRWHLVREHPTANSPSSRNSLAAPVFAFKGVKAGTYLHFTKAKRLPRTEEVYGLKSSISKKLIKGGYLIYRKAELSDPSLVTRALGVGAVPGTKLSHEDAKRSFHKIAKGSLDLFPTTESAERYLSASDFASTGQTAIELIEAGRAVTVLARLDELRYGSQG